MYALKLAEDGRILSATYPQYAPADAVIVAALPEGDISDYRYVAGQYVYEPLPEPERPEPETEASVWDELDAAYQEGVNSV
jgi:hypothetical protein